MEKDWLCYEGFDIHDSILFSGNYYRADLNFPASLPTRKDGIKSFEYDPPLSSCGVFQSRLIGRLFGIQIKKLDGMVVTENTRLFYLIVFTQVFHAYHSTVIVYFFSGSVSVAVVHADGMGLCKCDGPSTLLVFKF